MARALRKIYQLKVSLNGMRPPIWRRLLVSSSMDLSELHEIIQITMGWTDSHLHQFIVGEVFYGEPDPDWDNGTIPEYDVRIENLLKKAKQWLIYEYDFGDSWEHRIELEKILPYNPETITPTCTGGRRGCPPEDVGGVWGYAGFLEAYKDSKHPEHEDILEWAGEYFDPERFDMEEINQMLSS